MLGWLQVGRLGLGAVPALRKWKERPGQLVIVRGDLRAAQDILPWAAFDSRSHILKRLVELVRRGDFEYPHQSRRCF